MRDDWRKPSGQRRQQRIGKRRDAVDGSLPVNLLLFKRKPAGNPQRYESFRAGPMNSPRTSRLFGALLLVGTLLASLQSYARAPLQHPARGVIQSIDYTSRILVLAESKTNRVFVWKNYTRFRRGWHKASPDMLRAGQPIKVSYRREIGRFVLYEVRWSDTAPTNSLEKPSPQAAKVSQQRLRENASSSVSILVTETALRE